VGDVEILADGRGVRHYRDVQVVGRAFTIERMRWRFIQPSDE
jgi:hypothetical protein